MAQQNEKEIQQLKHRLQELADRAYAQGIFTFTGFLGLPEQEIFRQEEARLRYAGCSLSGGYAGAERIVVRFGNPEELGYEQPFPVVCLSVTPLMPKFAEQLTHRDFLGALMNLGISRSTIGDIKVGEKKACLFCLDSVAEFICDHLQQIRHTNVTCALTEASCLPEQEKPELLTVQVASLRVDAVLAKVYNMSREKSLELFRTGRVYVNGRLCENSARLLKSGETVNARGFGKLCVGDGVRETKKGKLAIEVNLYR